MFRSRDLFQTNLAVKTKAAFFVAAAVAILFLAGQLLWASRHIDRTSLERQRGTVSQELEEIIEKTPYDQLNVTIWDDAVAFTGRGFDQRWIDENLGLWMHDYFKHDRILILGRADQVIYSHSGGTTENPASGADLRNSVAPLVHDVRRKLSMPGIVRSEVQAYDTMLIDNRPAVVSVTPIVPSSERLKLEAGAETLHVSLRYLDTSLAELGTGHGFNGAHFTRTAADRSWSYFPIRSAAGQQIGYFAWEPHRPGLDLVKSSMPALGFATLALLLISWAFGRHIDFAAKELQLREAQAQHIAMHDSLTGLPNRAMLAAQLQSAVGLGAADRDNLAVLYLDLDRFKEVNDALGHAAGDALICEVGRRLQAIVREFDTVARLGGDEFAILQRNVTGGDDVKSLCARVIEAVRQPVPIGGSEVFVGVSAGAAIAAATDGGAADLLRKADIALYHAKADGPNSFRIFTEDMDEEVQQKRIIERDLRAALAAGDQFRLVFQPLYASGPKNSVVGLEALVRWEHPGLGMLSPALFIPIAESSGLILQLGEWVLRTACETVADWPVDYVAVNVSPLQFRSEGFVRLVQKVLLETELPPNRLELEVTEGVLVDSRGSIETLKALRDIGVRIALDDFGTGYSSLGYLREFQVDRIKIDQSFVRQLGEDADARSIVVAMVDLAKALGVEVTAEGVETAEQRAFLSEAGCDQLQGFLMSKPQPPEAIRELLHQGEGQFGSNRKLKGGLLPALLEARYGT